MKRLSVVMICFLIVISFCGCKGALQLPEGEWYCDELNLQLSLKPEYAFFISDNGEKLQCWCSQLPNDSYILVKYAKRYPGHDGNEIVFSGTIISIDDECVQIKERYTDDVYIFVKQ